MFFNKPNNNITDQSSEQALCGDVYTKSIPIPENKLSNVSVLHYQVSNDFLSYTMTPKYAVPCTNVRTMKLYSSQSSHYYGKCFVLTGKILYHCDDKKHYYGIPLINGNLIIIGTDNKNNNLFSIIEDPETFAHLFVHLMVEQQMNLIVPIIDIMIKHSIYQPCVFLHNFYFKTLSDVDHNNFEATSITSSDNLYETHEIIHPFKLWVFDTGIKEVVTTIEYFSPNNPTK